MTKFIVVANQKGGVGKTTTAVNLSAALGTFDKRILLVDLDPQANCTSGVGIDKNKIDYPRVDSPKIFLFIEDVQNASINNALVPFDNFNDMESYLKQQLEHIHFLL